MIRIELDNLLEISKHDRTSCSDEHIANGLSTSLGAGRTQPRCIRCSLLEIKSGKVAADYDLRLCVDVYFERIKEKSE